MADMAYFLVYFVLKSLLELWQTFVIARVSLCIAYLCRLGISHIYDWPMLGITYLWLINADLCNADCVMQFCVLHICELWIAVFVNCRFV